MSDTTVHLEMPYILPSQAQKHVTHNEALQRLDAVVQLTLTASRDTPPEEPQEGDCFAITQTPSGEWSGRAGKIAVRQDGTWLFLTPRAGWLAWHSERNAPVIFDGEAWVPLPLPEDGNLQTLGISTSANGTNRLALAADASLFTHAGHGHQLKINKAAAGDTASLLFQSNWSGYAEMGLAGDNSFSIKTSDGSNWYEALRITPDGAVKRPRNPAFIAGRAAGTAAPVTGSQSGFTEISNLQGTASLGAALSQGAAILVPETGLYFLSLRLAVVSGTDFSVTLTQNGTAALATLQGNSSGVTLTTSAIALLSAGDSLSMVHSGTTTLEFGAGKTELTTVML